MALIAILMIAVVYVSCSRTQEMLKPATDDTMMSDKMIDMLPEITEHRSRVHVMLSILGVLDVATYPSEKSKVPSFTYIEN